jgi:hypothetical protein
MLLYKVRCGFCRYDYENCDAESCAAMMNKLERIVTSPVYVGTKIIHRNKSYVVKLADNFCYEDPVDGSITERQVCYTASHYVHQLLLRSFKFKREFVPKKFIYNKIKKFYTLLFSVVPVDCHTLVLTFWKLLNSSFKEGFRLLVYPTLHSCNDLIIILESLSSSNPLHWFKQ